MNYQKLKKICVIIMCVGEILCMRTFAQTERRSHFNIVGGVSFPMGDFSDARKSNPLSGYANSGYILGFSFTTQISKISDLEILALASSNTLDHDALDRDYRSNANYSLDEVVPWYLGWLMIGAGFSPEVDSDVRLFFRPYLGIMAGKNPAIIVRTIGSPTEDNVIKCCSRPLVLYRIWSRDNGRCKT